MKMESNQEVTQKDGLAPGGGTLIFSYIRRLGSFFWVQNFFSIFFGVLKKKFLGYEDFVGIFFWIITKLDYI